MQSRPPTAFDLGPGRGGYPSEGQASTDGIGSLTVGMIVGGATDIHAIGIDHLIEEGASWGLRRPTVATRIGDLLERLPDAIEAASDLHPHLSPGLVAHIADRVATARADFASTCP